MTESNAPLPTVRLPTEIRAGEGFLWQTYTIKAPPDATLDDAANNSSFWQHTCQFDVGDHIKCASVAGLWYAEFLVRSISPNRNGAEVATLSAWSEPDPDVMTAGGLSVVWLDERRRWALVMSDNTHETVRDGIRSRSEAAATLKAMTGGKKSAKAAG